MGLRWAWRSDFSKGVVTFNGDFERVPQEEAVVGVER
jgi:hypothetical protein